MSLDQVDTGFLATILDILDFYELFKLSMMLCNRYNMTERISSYILHLALKYSFVVPVAQMDADTKVQKLQAAALSHEALHSVLGYV